MLFYNYRKTLTLEIAKSIKELRGNCYDHDVNSPQERERRHCAMCIAEMVVRMVPLDDD